MTYVDLRVPSGGFDGTAAIGQSAIQNWRLRSRGYKFASDLSYSPGFPGDFGAFGSPFGSPFTAQTVPAETGANWR
jgi:hypothetical protein